MENRRIWFGIERLRKNFSSANPCCLDACAAQKNPVCKFATVTFYVT